MSITRNWPRSRRSASCAPRSNWNRDPNPIRRRSHSPRSPRPPARTSAVGGSHLPHEDAAKFDAALASHRDALFAQWKQDHGASERASQNWPPLPTTVEAFMRLVQAGWDDEAARRPHGQHTTVVVHVDVAQRAAALHLGPLLTDAERRYLTCDATCEVWFERHGEVIGAGRASRVINRRLRRALEHRHPSCAVPGCGATRGLHAHHIRHWEDGGPTDLPNLVLVCPYHHRLHHRGGITIAGPTDDLIVTDSCGRHSAQGRWHVLQTFPRPPSRRARGPPASAPTGGGTTHSNHNHHQQTTRLAIGAGRYRHHT